ncbi:MAG TPA: hypothetical protein VJ806_12360 [Luteimonas sp.]|nr:hypothetical protein [Luteimonas sp.]
MMRESLLIVALLAFFSPAAFASQTVCVFEADPSAHYYEVEFIGDGDAKPVIVFSSTDFGAGKRFTLSVEHYVLKHFDPKAGSVDLEFHNPGDVTPSPSFGLVGSEGRARLKTGSMIIDGEFKCGN